MGDGSIQRLQPTARPKPSRSGRTSGSATRCRIWSSGLRPLDRHIQDRDLGNGTTNLNNIRGMGGWAPSVYVANAGTGFGNAIVSGLTANTAFLGSAISQFVSGTDHSPDIKYVNNGLLVSVYAASGTTGTSRIDRYDLAGNYLGNPLRSGEQRMTTGIRGPQQINTDGNNLLIASFSGTARVGPLPTNSAISTLNFYAGGLGPRAGYRLDSGKIAITRATASSSWTR